MDERYLTPEQVAGRLQVNVVTVHRWLRTGKLKGYKLGHRLWRVSPEQIKEFVVERRT